MNNSASYASLRGRRVFVTGGGSGIGESIVSAFAAQGAHVAFVDIQRDASMALCERIAADGHPAPLFRQCDITDIPALQATMAELGGRLGDFDVLVNNAGNDHRHDIDTVTQQEWDRCIAINQRPMFFTSQAVVPGMKRRGGGSIINLSSVSWRVKGGGYPVYVTTKAAVVGLTRSLARDLGGHRIRVNTVTPGWVMTERQVALWVSDEDRAEMARTHCLPGELLPHHIASMVLFLAADDSAMCTGHDFVVDAGWT